MPDTHQYRQFLKDFCDQHNLDQYNSVKWDAKYKDNKQLNLAALSCDCQSLAHVSLRLQNDPEVVLMAIKSNVSGKDMVYASDELKSDKGFVLWSLDNGARYNFIEHCHDDIRNDKEVILNVLDKDIAGLLVIGDKLKSEMNQIKWVKWSNDFSEYKQVLKDKIVEENMIFQRDTLLDFYPNKKGFKPIKL